MLYMMSIVVAIQIIPQVFASTVRTLLQHQRKLSDRLQLCENHKILNVDKYHKMPCYVLLRTFAAPALNCL